MLVSVEQAGQRYCRKPREQVQGCIQRATRLVGLPSQRARNVLTILAAVAPSRCRWRYSLVSGRGAAAIPCFAGHAANTLGIGRTPVRSPVAQGTQIEVCTLLVIRAPQSSVHAPYAKVGCAMTGNFIDQLRQRFHDLVCRVVDIPSSPSGAENIPCR
jgi:hypothetical protein